MLHDPPDALRWYKLKPYQDRAKSSDQPPSAASGKKKHGVKSPIASTKKIDIMRGLAWEHPTRTLDMGLVRTNVQKVVSDTAVASDIRDCIGKAVCVASDAKRAFQEVLGQYLDMIFVKKKFLQSDQIFLDHLCAREVPTSSKESPDTEESGDKIDALDDLTDGSNQEQFIAMLLRHLVSGEQPRRTSLGVICSNFISRLGSLGIPLARVDNPMGFPTTHVTRSAAKQLEVELKNHFRNGSHELHEQVSRDII